VPRRAATLTTPAGGTGRSAVVPPSRWGTKLGRLDPKTGEVPRVKKNRMETDLKIPVRREWCGKEGNIWFTAIWRVYREDGFRATGQKRDDTKCQLRRPNDPHTAGSDAHGPFSWVFYVQGGGKYMWPAGSKDREKIELKGSPTEGRAFLLPYGIQINSKGRAGFLEASAQNKWPQ